MPGGLLVRAPTFLALALLLAGCVDPATPSAEIVPAALAPGALAGAPDPLALGELAFERLEYDFGERPFVSPAEPAVYPTRLRGSLHVPDGEGPFPVVLFQHGRHSTCATALREILTPLAARCPTTPASEPVDSHEGYDHFAENLASHGIFVVSVDAGDVNDWDGAPPPRVRPDAGAAARAHIVLETLDELARLNASADDPRMGDRLTGLLDLSRIGLMGHSRGGEGVTYSTVVNAARAEAERHAIRAVFALAPIDATRVEVEGVAWATLLPYCDGDVWSLSGARFFDDSRDVADGHLRTQILVMGANHNFYNTKWPQDDAGWFPEDDPACGTAARLTAEEQRAQGIAHINSFFRLHLAGETSYAPLFDGRATLPASACPATRSCEDLVHVSATSSHRLLLRDVPVALDAPTMRVETCTAPDCDGAFAVGSAKRAVVSWSEPGAMTFALDAPTDARALGALTFRVAFDPGPNDVAPDLRVAVVDVDGAEASVDASSVSRALYLAPGGPDARKLVLNDVRLPLAAFAGVDLANLVAVRIEPTTPGGQMHLADVALQP